MGWPIVQTKYEVTTMEMTDIGAVLGLIMAGYMVGAFVYFNYLLNAEARASTARKKKKALAATVVKAAECCSPPPKCCASEETTLDA